MTYEANVDTLTNALQTVLTGITEFGSRVYFGNFKELANYPSCTFTLKDDKLTPHAVKLSHDITYDVLIFTRGGSNSAETDMSDLISIVGKVIDAIDTNQTELWDWAGMKLEFSFNRAQSFLLYIAHLEVTISTTSIHGFYDLTLASRELDNSTVNLGTIDIGKGSIVLPSVSTIHKKDSVLAVHYDPSSGHMFDSWEITTDTIDNSTANPANVTIKGSGTLTAVYREPIEQLDNGGFEDGDGSGWTNAAGNATASYVNNAAVAYAGNYYASLPNYAGLIQTLGIQLPVSQIHNWTIYTRALASSTTLEIQIVYSDATSTTWTATVGTTWTAIDLLSHAVAGKTVASFRFSSLSGTTLLVDGCTLTI